MEKKIISLNELSEDDIRGILDLSIDLKKNSHKYGDSLKGKALLLLFQKTSTRTRVAFELGMKKIGGSTVVLDWDKSNFAISPIEYEARFADTVFDCILARLIKNEAMKLLAQSVKIPVINGCDDLFHPSQALADLLTIYEVKGNFNTTLCYVGIQNNVANSLLFACERTGVKLIFITPLKDGVPEEVKECMDGSTLFEETPDLEYGVSNCEFLYTDTWINMENFHDEEYRSEKERRIKAMLPYQINRDLIKNRNVYIMHDMPVHPGFEIDDYSITCEKSVIYRQAENRLYTAQALLLKLLEDA